MAYVSSINAKTSLQHYCMLRQFTTCRSGSFSVEDLPMVSSMQACIPNPNSSPRSSSLAGTASGGLLLPLVLPPLLSKYGSSLTLRYLSIVQLCLSAIAVPLIKGRLPANRASAVNIQAHRTATISRSYVKDWTFWVILVATLVQGLAYFVPILWLPSKSIFTSQRATSPLNKVSLP